MRSRAATGGRYGRGTGTPFSKLLVLVLAGACLVFGYVYLYGPSSGAVVRRQALSAVRMHTGTEAGGASQTQQKDDSSTLAASGSDASSGASTAHSTVQIIGQDDPRHPKNVKQLISQASHHDEHQHDALDEAKKQQSDVSEHDQQEGAAAGAGGAAAGGAKDAKAAGGAAAGSGEGAGVAAGTPGAQNGAKAAGSGGSATQGTGTGAADASGATSPAAEEHHEIDSGVKATAASLQHATEHLKEATELLTKQAAEVKAAAAGKGTEAGAAGAAGAAGKAAAGSGAAGSGTAATGGDKKVAQGTVATPVAAAAAATNATTAATDAAGKATTAVERAKAKATGPLPDLLAYSKDQGQPGDTIHVLFTSNGSPYQNIQARVMVGTYNLVRKLPGGEKLVAMTRILHRTTPDEVMDEIPTFRAQPLQPECDKWCWFPVADRANAVQQWVDAVHQDHSLVKAPWLLLLETDYVWMKPLLAMGSAYDPKVPGLAFRFDYIAPMNPVVAEILKEYCPDCDPTTVPGSGPAPVLIRFSDLRAATPLWEDLSLWIETHPDAKKQLGWVREMYAWDIGVAANKLNILTQPSGTTTLISQPPHDHLIHNATMFHYTWGCIVKDKDDKEVWKFDKRFYTKAEDALKLPTFVEPPEWVAGLHVHDGTPWTEDLRNTMMAMIHQMNLAVATAADLTATAKAAAAA